ncbi:MAG TPA: hypothetical protein VIS78_11325, partial [Blastocatellia bacterium]
KIARPTVATTAMKIFEARLSFDGSDIALSWHAGDANRRHEARFADESASIIDQPVCHVGPCRGNP